MSEAPPLFEPERVLLTVEQRRLIDDLRSQLLAFDYTEEVACFLQASDTFAALNCSLAGILIVRLH